MLQHMCDIGHDIFHSYRVLYHSLMISKHYEPINVDVLIASCLLHDVGRSQTMNTDYLCHAIEGSKMAYEFLKQNQLDESFCMQVRDCIATHRFKTETPPQTIEAKILYDADKLEASYNIFASIVWSKDIIWRW